MSHIFFIIKFQLNMTHATRISENGKKQNASSLQFSSFTGAANLKNNQNHSKRHLIGK